MNEPALLFLAIVAACFAYELPAWRRNFGRATERAWFMLSGAFIVWVTQ